MMDELKEVRQIPIEDIIPNRFQPRINFDEKALNELSESIKQHGIIQPLVLRPLGDKFEIIAGERRYKAATLAGLSTVPGIVTEMDDNTSAEVALIENVQRKDLSAIEEAKSYKNMLERSNMTQEELAKKMGLSQSTIANKLRLLNLSEEVQNALSQEKISERHARALLAIPNKEEQVKWLNRIINERLTVRQLDLAIKDEQNVDKTIEEDIPKVNINPDIDSIINNAVDINSDSKPVQNNGINNIFNNDVEPGANKPTNKFFNYLEDQEVNMSVTEEPTPASEVASSEDFKFSPDFNLTDIPVQEEEIDTLDDEPILPAAETPVVNEIASEPISPVEENVISPVVEPVVNNNEISNTIPNEEVVSNKIVQEEPEFIFDDDDDIITENNTVQPDVEPEVEKKIEIEPIPVVEGEGIVDPVTYYDTLDPDFMDKVKEYVGLDLKNAINSYRDLTKELNEKGFNISIEETDLDNKYYIEININKE